MFHTVIIIRVHTLPVKGGVSSPYSDIFQPTGHGGDQIPLIPVVHHPGLKRLGKSLDAASQDLFADNVGTLSLP